MTRSKIYSLLSILIFWFALALGILIENATASTVEKQDEVLLAPVADSHVHLLSPVTSKMAEEPPLPPIKLPDEFANLLRERERVWNDKNALAKLYTGNSVLLNLNNGDLPGWIIGGQAIANEMAQIFSRAYSITPVAYSLEGASGNIAGYFTRREEDRLKYIGYVFLALTRDSAGAWRIAAETPTFPGPTVREPITAQDAIAQLDEARIQRGVVLSVAYWFGSAWSKPVENEYEKVKAENDWVADQVAKFPDRLVAFCGLNPLKDYAVEEVNRCSKNRSVKGIKLHFGNSNVDLNKADHVEKVRGVFRAANDQKLAILAHLWTGPEYEAKGGELAKIFLDQILLAAPDVTIQIAHMGGGGRSTDAALAVFAEAIGTGDARTKNLYFDVATLTQGQSAEGLQKDASRMRRIGLDRILYGTDTTPPNPSPRISWGTFRALMPLTDEEFKKIAANVPPYLQ